MGRVVGNFYDAAGKATAALATVHTKAAEGKKKKVRTPAIKQLCRLYRYSRGADAVLLCVWQ
jgi:hypothetical protein